MKYIRPDVAEVRKVIDERGIETVVLPRNDDSLTEEEVDALSDRVFRIKETRSDATPQLSDVFTNLDTTTTDGESVVEIAEVDVELLAKLLYEHRRYAAARGFSDSEMDVLRAIEFHRATRVGIDEIMDDEHTEDLAESTVYKALRTLQEKGLIEKIRPGVYRYDGP